MATTRTSDSTTRLNWRQQSRADFSALWAMLRSASPWILLAPAFTALLVWFSQYSVWHSLLRKDFQEIAAPITLAVATILAGLLFAKNRATFTGWIFVLAGALLCRELHFWGTNNGIYIILVLLFLFAGRKHETMQPFAANRAVTSLLFGAMWAYFIAKTFDRGYWRRVFPEVATIRDAMEESIETTGHLLILAMVIIAWRIAAGLRHANNERTGRRTATLWAIGLLIVGSAATAWAVRWYQRDESVSPTRKPGGLPYELSSLCKVDSRIGHDLFLIGSDEFRTLALCRISDGGEVEFLSDLELKVLHPDGGHVFLDDLEGLAADGAGNYFAVTSHRQLDDGKAAKRLKKSQGSERAVVCFRLERTAGGVKITAAKLVTKDLLAAVRQLSAFKTVNWKHAKSFRWRDWKSSWQVDIEGLAVCEDQLLFGFKNPVEDGRAASLGLDLNTGKLTVVARPDFAGQGILGLHHDRDLQQLNVVTNNPMKGRFGRSCLWVARRNANTGRWEFGSQPEHILEDGASIRRKAAGIVRDGNRWIVCIGDDRRPVVRIVPRGANRSVEFIPRDKQTRVE